MNSLLVLLIMSKEIVLVDNANDNVNSVSTNNMTPNMVGKKRGRKSKKEIKIV